MRASAPPDASAPAAEREAGDDGRRGATGGAAARAEPVRHNGAAAGGRGRGSRCWAHKPVQQGRGFAEDVCGALVDGQLHDEDEQGKAPRRMAHNAHSKAQKDIKMYR